MEGRIIFYNLDEGSGLILSNQKQKYKFDIEAWDDIEVMPDIGLRVVFQVQDGKIISVEQKREKPKQESQNPAPVEDVARIIFEEDDPDLISHGFDANSYSVKTVPKGLIDKKLNDFFSSVQVAVDKYQDYMIKDGSGSLNFFKIKRFLFTAYNNILEIDPELADGQLMEVFRNIQEVNAIHDLYKKNSMFTKIAFSNIFLRYTRYKEAKARLERNISEMGAIGSDLVVMESEMRHIMEDIAKCESDIESKEYFTQKLRHVKRQYVDAIDRRGTLREENELLIPLTDEYFAMFFEEFTKKFESSYEKNISSLIQVLDSMAFLFDRLMWQKASSSRVIKRYFSEAGIDYPYSSLTYLRYYLKTLDTSHLSSENKELFALLEYLEKKSKK